MDEDSLKDLLERLTAGVERLAAGMERLAPPPVAIDLTGGDAFLWQARPPGLMPVKRVNRVPLQLLWGIDRQREALLANTRQFAAGLPANNALLWGARGMGKSSLVKAVHQTVNDNPGNGQGTPLALIEIHREDIADLPLLLQALSQEERRAILFCDDLSFDLRDSFYKSLKAVLEGGIEGRPENVIFYATSNRRHLMPREMIENEQETAIHPGDTADEKISLSDRFGLWLGFHACNQDTYLAMVDGYVRIFGLTGAGDVHKAAIEWSMTRGARSGRVAWQFIQDLAGRLGQPLDDVPGRKIA